MRVLLDEHLPVRLARELHAHEVSTVRDEGWSGKQNGELLALASESGFDVLVTNDISIEHQQDLRYLRVGIVFLGAPSNNLEDLVPLVPATLDAIADSGPGRVVHLAR